MELFEVVADALRGMVPPELGEPRCSWHRYGVKVWFGPEKATRLHYEAQVVGRRHVPEAETLALEVGFHAEEPKPDVNDTVLAHLLAHQRRWRKDLGRAPVAGEFLGRDTWARVSEVWLDPDLSDEDLGVEVAARLTDYIEALEPVLRDRPPDRARIASEAIRVEAERRGGDRPGQPLDLGFGVKRTGRRLTPPTSGTPWASR